MEVLDRELSIYPPASSDHVDVNVECYISEENSPKIVSNNPKEFQRFSDGFTMNFGSTRVFWREESKPVRVRLKIPGDAKDILKKYRSIQFTHDHESVGQTFHELVLCTTLQLFFNKRFSLIHGSAIRNTENEVTIFGGTGGVGKTSLMLELAGSKSNEFMADDIAIVEPNGTVQCNLAFPKIYGYNTIGHPEILARVFKNRSRFDQIAWKLKLIRNGPSYVRRRVSPFDFFDGRVANSGKLKRLFLLFRCNTPNLQAIAVDSSVAVEMNLSVMKAEYYDLYNQMHWGSFNYFARCNEIFSVDQLFETWRKLQTEVLEHVDCRLIKIPNVMGARALKHEVKKMASELNL